MDEHERDQQKKMAKQIGELHAVVFGVEGQGGLHRWVSQLNNDVQILKQFQANLTGLRLGLVSAWVALGGIMVWLANLAVNK